MSRQKKKIHKELGERIKAIRLEKGMKIIEVANITGLTSSMISQVERSLISPSIDTLRKISNALSVSASYFFEDSETEVNNNNNGNTNFIIEKSPVVRKHQRKVLSPGPGVTFYLLNPDLSGPIELIYNIYEPNTGTGSEQYTHIGTECGLILEGQLVITIGDKEYVLEKGDSITFSSEDPHSKTNRGDVPCICVWANTPPWF